MYGAATVAATRDQGFARSRWEIMPLRMSVLGYGAHPATHGCDTPDVEQRQSSLAYPPFVSCSITPSGRGPARKMPVQGIVCGAGAGFRRGAGTRQRVSRT